MEKQEFESFALYIGLYFKMAYDSQNEFEKIEFTDKGFKLTINSKKIHFVPVENKRNIKNFDNDPKYKCDETHYILKIEKDIDEYDLNAFNQYPKKENANIKSNGVKKINIEEDASMTILGGNSIYINFHLERQKISNKKSSTHRLSFLNIFSYFVCDIAYLKRELPKVKLEFQTTLNFFNLWLLHYFISHYKFGFVLGTGVSIPYGAMSWNKMLEQMNNKLDSICTKKEHILNATGGDNYSNAELIKLFDKNYLNIIKDCLYRSKYIPPFKSLTMIRALIELVIKKNEAIDIITYNYDDFLEKEITNYKYDFNIKYNDTSLLDDANLFNIYHVHGYLPQYNASKSHFDSIVLSEIDYFKMYSNQMNWNVVKQLETFHNDVCVFLGNSVKDQYEKNLLSMSINTHKFNFIFLRNYIENKDAVEEIDELDKIIITRYFFQLGILVIWVHSFDETITKLSSLASMFKEDASIRTNSKTVFSSENDIKHILENPPMLESKDIYIFKKYLSLNYSKDEIKKIIKRLNIK